MTCSPQHWSSNINKLIYPPSASPQQLQFYRRGFNPDFKSSPAAVGQFRCFFSTLIYVFINLF
uniref:Uncharacterized protein n=1 Tax=Ciona intestinalis TaxID=7719 RepID=H2XR07_CIOIN